MSTFETQQPNSPDDQMESLLRDFFAGEMPAEVSELTNKPVTRRAPVPVRVEQPAARRMTTRVARCIGAAAALAGVLVLAWNIAPEGNRGIQSSQVADMPVNDVSANQELATVPAESTVPDQSSEMQPVAGASASRPAAFAFPPGYLVTENVAALGLRKYATILGPVEQRTRVRTTSVSYFEPASGAQVRVNVPEIEIEILAARN